MKMASKRSQILVGLAKHKDDAGNNNDDARSEESSIAPSILAADQQIIDDAITRANIVGLGREKSSDLTEQWVKSQISRVVESSPLAHKNKPARLVDYSPSLTSASSRVSAESKTSAYLQMTARKRKMFAPPAPPATRPHPFLTQSVCKDLTNIYQSSPARNESGTARSSPSRNESDAARSGSPRKVSELFHRSPSIRSVSETPQSSALKNVSETRVTPSRSVSLTPQSTSPPRQKSETPQLLKTAASIKKMDASKEFVDKPVNACSKIKSSLKPARMIKYGGKLHQPLSSREPRTTRSRQLTKPESEKKLKCGVQLHQSPSGHKPPTASRLQRHPSRDIFLSANGEENLLQKQTEDRLVLDSESSLSEKSVKKKSGVELHQSPSSHKPLTPKPCRPRRNPSSEIFASEGEDEALMQKESEDTLQSSGMVLEPESNLSNKNSSITPCLKTGSMYRQVAENIKKQDVSNLKEAVKPCSSIKPKLAKSKTNQKSVDEPSSSPNPIRSTRTRRPRKPSPDFFASADEDDDLFPVDSDDSLVLDSESSSSSVSGTAFPTASKERNLELAEMQDDSDEERHLVPQKKERKKKQNSSLNSKEEKSKRKHLRNTGQQYQSSSKKVVPARQRKQPHVCKRRCHEVITDDVGESIFNEYWEQGSHEKRVSYLASRVEICPVKIKRPRLPADHKKSHPKSVSHKYFFHIHGETKQVCKQTFLRTIGETDGFLRIAVSNKSKTLSGVTKEDRRGKHTPPHKIKPETVEEVKQHVLKFPSYKSHYKRAEVGDTRYLPCNLDRKQMHQMYLDEGGTFVSYSSYERIFNTLGRSFKKPHTDTCEKCDAWKEQVKSAPDEVTQERLKKEWNTHLDRAKAAYDFKKKCKVQAESDPSLRVLIFDLEQVLETPLLTTGAAFYLRQLSTYNLTIYDTTTKMTHCYMWSEIDGKRGANEIASCIFLHCLDEIPGEVKKVILFSDSTIGQNRNSIVAAMFLTLLQMHNSIKTVEHVFLEAGHTRLEVDSKHSVIERKKDHADRINMPCDWYNLVRSIGASSKHYPNGRFKVTEMKGEFYDFQSFLKGPLVRRTVSTSNDKFVWLTTPLLRYDAQKPGKVFFKKSLADIGFGCLDFQRAGKAGAYAAENLQKHLKQLYPNPLPVSVNKKKDLMKLLHLLPPSCHDFYKSISSGDAVHSDDADNPNSDYE